LPGDLTDPGTADAQVDLLFRERAFWLFLTGHRLGDLRRLIRQYGRTADTVFPSGTYFKGGQPYGAAVNLPLPATETNNPKVTGCLDREA
jgi:starch-binding outer membrane protein, SusD/RagB family